MDRYEIGCQHCGVLELAQSRIRAVQAARSQQQQHRELPCIVTIFDRMARYGSWELWTIDGKPLSIRSRS